jgi:ribosome-associated protein
MLEKKGEEIVIMDLRKLTSMTDYFVLCSADSDVQIKAIMEHIREQLGSESVSPWHVEGTQESSWLLLDFVDVVAHIFRPETRSFYSLERLWGDAKFTEIKDENETPGIH